MSVHSTALDAEIELNFYDSVQAHPTHLQFRLPTSGSALERRWYFSVLFQLAYKLNYALATSTAPTIGRKRRISSTEMDTDDEAPQSLSKKPRASKQEAEDEVDDVATPVPESSPPPGELSQPAEEVKDVTKGVKTIDLETPIAASVALPSAEALSTRLPETSDVSEAPATDAESTKVESEDVEKEEEEVLSKDQTEIAEVGESVEVLEEKAAEKSPVVEEESGSDAEVLADDIESSPDVSESKPDSKPEVDSLTLEKINHS